MTFPLHDKKFLSLVIAVIVVITLEIFSISGLHIPLPYAPFLYATFILGIGYKTLWNGLKAITTFKFSSINLLMTIAVIGAFYLGQYPEAAVVIVLYVLGERLEDIGIANSKSALDKLVSASPKTATLKNNNEPVAIDKIPVGSTIQVKAGELIPLDGKIISGATTVDEAAITGEPIPKDKHTGDHVFAGTLNKNGFIEIETTRTANDTTFAKIVKLTFEAQANKSETQKFIQKFSKYYTPTVIVIASLVLIIPVFIFNLPFDRWLLQAITLLVIACPCALVISTPVAIYAAIGNATSKGVIIKGGKYIEALAGIRIMCLDKTRTITFGKPVVSDIFPLQDTTKEELLACAAGAEIFSEHPLADAIVDASRKAGFKPHEAENYKSFAGKGAMAECLVCEDETIFVGKLSFIKEHQPVTQEAERIVEQLAAEGKTSVVISFGNGVAGILGLMDEIKPGVKEVITELEKMKIETVMLTGDNEKAGKYVAAQVGIKKVYGALLPDQKAEKINELLLHKTGVAMVGDGINDAPALAKATVGISMGSAGSDTAIETANIALMNDRLDVIPFLIRLCRATVNRIRINTIGAILVKLIFVSLAISGYSNLVMAITADVGVTLVVILTSLNLVKYS